MNYAYPGMGQFSYGAYALVELNPAIADELEGYGWGFIPGYLSTHPFHLDVSVHSVDWNRDHKISDPGPEDEYLVKAGITWATRRSL